MGSSLQLFCSCGVVMTGLSIFVIVECGVTFDSFVNLSD